MEVENVCVECGQPFITKDEEACYCDNCWNKLMEQTFKTDNEQTD